MGLWTINITMFVTKTWHNLAKFAPWYQTPMLIFNSALSQHWHTRKAILRNFKKIYKEEKTTLIPNMVCLPGLLTQWQNALHRSLLSHRLYLAMQKHTTPAEGYQTFMVLKYMFHQRRRQRLSLSSSLSNSAAAPCEQQHINSSTVYRHWQKPPLLSACRSASQNAPFQPKPPLLHVHQIKLWQTLFNFF